MADEITFQSDPVDPAFEFRMDFEVAAREDTGVLDWDGARNWRP